MLYLLIEIQLEVILQSDEIKAVDDVHVFQELSDVLVVCWTE